MPDETVPQVTPPVSPTEPIVPSVFATAPAAAPSGQVIVSPASSIMATAQTSGYATMKTTAGNFIVIAVTEEDYQKLVKTSEATGWSLKVEKMPIMTIPK